MKKIECIINRYMSGYVSCEFWYDPNLTICFKLKTGSHHLRSFLWLLSPESGFLQACKWKENEYGITITKYNEIWEDIFGWDYHAMRLSILSQEEKIKYLEENVIVD